MSTKKFAPNDWFKTSTGLTVHDVTTQVGFRTTRVSVGTTPTPLPENALTDRQFVRIQVVGGGTVFTGGADVTILNGLNNLPFGIDTLAIEDTAILYGIVATGTIDVIVMEGL